MAWKGQDIISIEDFSVEDIREFIGLAGSIKSSPAPDRALAGTMVALLFFEASTRTRTSFRAATERMGGQVCMEIAGPTGTSLEKGESVKSTIRMAEAYGADIIVVRHPRDGSARYVADITDKPVINAGDGYREHPTQNFLDLFTIHERFGRLDHLTFVFFGDLRYGRATRVVIPLSRYPGNRFLFLSHPHVAVPDRITAVLDKAGCSYEEFSAARDFPILLKEADVAYGSRTQRERFPKTAEGEELLRQVQGSVVLTRGMLESSAKGTLIVMHPLPDDKEHPCIAQDVDETPWAHYQKQAANGIPARQALLSLITGGRP